MPDVEPGAPEKGLQSLADAEARAARDAETRRLASSVVGEIRALRTENHWRDRVASLFREPKGT